MRQKSTIIIAVFLLLAIIGLMVWDFYYESKQADNPYEYSLDDLKKIDESEICYSKAGEINPDIKGAYAMAIDEKDRIFVAGESQISVMNKVGDIIKKTSIISPATCIAVDAQGNVFIGTKSHIEVYDRNLRLKNQWPEINANAHITSIAAEDNSVFVADAGNKIIYHFDADGTLINTIGEKNPETGFGGFIIPSPHFDVALGREGQLWVVNTGKHEFLAFNKNGEIFSSWKKTSMQLEGFSGCCNPGNIALLTDGSFVTSEKGIERVKIHLPNGDYKCVVAGPGELSAGCQHFDLAVNSEDHIYVLDTKSGMVKIFKRNQNLTGLPPETETKAIANCSDLSNNRPVRFTFFTSSPTLPLKEKGVANTQTNGLLLKSRIYFALSLNLTGLLPETETKTIANCSDLSNNRPVRFNNSINQKQINNYG